MSGATTDKRVVAPATALGLRVVDSTVNVGGRLLAGFAVRSLGGRLLGNVWATGNSWQWRTPDEKHYGERSSAHRALEVLAQIADLPSSRARVAAPPPPMPAAPRVAVVVEDAPAPAPPPRQRIVWGEATDVDAMRDSISASLKRHQR